MVHFTPSPPLKESALNVAHAKVLSRRATEQGEAITPAQALLGHALAGITAAARLGEFETTLKFAGAGSDDLNAREIVVGRLRELGYAVKQSAEAGRWGLNVLWK